MESIWCLVGIHTFVCGKSSKKIKKFAGKKMYGHKCEECGKLIYSNLKQM